MAVAAVAVADSCVDERLDDVADSSEWRNAHPVGVGAVSWKFAGCLVVLAILLT